MAMDISVLVCKLADGTLKAMAEDTAVNHVKLMREIRHTGKLDGNPVSRGWLIKNNPAVAQFKCMATPPEMMAGAGVQTIPRRRRAKVV